MFTLASTIFLSAFLLFQVQPLVAKSILPWFGGSAAVWTTCMLFFQVVLLLGYLYAHVLVTRFKPRQQATIHITLLLLSLLSLPIAPRAFLKPMGDEEPTLRIMLLLAFTVGLPYFLLSTTGSLLQAWFDLKARAGGTRETFPYRLYALSNVGSLLALVSYPVLIEPAFALQIQQWAWSGAYLLFVGTCSATAWRIRDIEPLALESVEDETAGAPPSRRRCVGWVLLAMCSSTLLLGVSSHLSQNVAAIPFLWVLPLSLYLLSFIICFNPAVWVWRQSFLAFPLGLVALMAYGVNMSSTNIDIKTLIPVFSLGLFVCCVLCHGELAKQKPHPRYLTTFYLMLALGGALGGVFVGIVAPLLFSGDYELPLALAGCALVALVALYQEPKERWASPFWQEPYWMILAGATAVIVLFMLGGVIRHRRINYRMGRNFYGVLAVREINPPIVDDRRRQLVHGTILHGEQFHKPSRKRQATSYFGVTSGVGRVIRKLQPAGPMKVGIIGLGVGTIASYNRKEDVYRFYEINPLVLNIAQTEFDYLKGAPGKVDVALGDARLVLEREEPQGYDVLAVDAFSSDAIPIHLLTKEAFELYFRQLKPEGILCIHTSNRYLDLAPVVAKAAAAVGAEAQLMHDFPPADGLLSSTTWVTVTKRKGFFTIWNRDRVAETIDMPPNLRLWTDDYSNLFQIMR